MRRLKGLKGPPFKRRKPRPAIHANHEKSSARNVPVRSATGLSSSRKSNCPASASFPLSRPRKPYHYPSIAREPGKGVRTIFAQSPRLPEGAVRTQLKRETALKHVAEDCASPSGIASKHEQPKYKYTGMDSQQSIAILSKPSRCDPSVL